MTGVIQRLSSILVRDEVAADILEMLTPPPAVPMPPVQPPRSIVGGLVDKLNKSLEISHGMRTDLEARIAKDTETLRQVNASIAAVETAMISISDDPALTQEERDLAHGIVDAEIMADLERGIAQAYEDAT